MAALPLVLNAYNHLSSMSLWKTSSVRISWTALTGPLGSFFLIKKHFTQKQIVHLKNIIKMMHTPIT